MPSAGTPARKGVYHKVKKGETLWRISQAYNVDINDIAASNHIPDAAVVEENQLLLIPGADSVKETETNFAEDLHKDEFAWPLRGRVVEYFGDHKGMGRKKGIEIEGQEGDKVLASRQGKVVFADYLPGYAYTVILDHQDGFFSVYSNNSRILAHVGDVVAKGEAVAQIGKKHNLAFLHFEIRKNSMAYNPMYYLPKL